MTKKELLNRIEELEETMMMTFDVFEKRLNNLKSVQGTVTHQIQTIIQPLVNELEVVKKNLAFNAQLMNLLMEHFNIGFYEVPAQEGKIEIRKKPISKVSKK